jgi:hypothetical protein
MPNALIAGGVIAALAVFGWVATVQRGFLRVWLAWTVFCLILFPAILATRGQLDPHRLVGAAILAPVAALLAWLWYYGRGRLRRG